MNEKTQKGAVAAIISIIVVILGSILIAGLCNGWFNDVKIKLEPEFYGTAEQITLDVETYEKLIKDRKSFIMISYLPGCTANILTYAKNFSNEHQISIYYLDFSSVRESTLKDTVKYSPSVIVVSDGRVKSHLRADNNEDVEKYNDYVTFKTWLESLIEF